MLEGFGPLRAWVTSVVVVTLLAAFAELLVPDSSIGKHVRLVLGLTVVLCLLSPLAAPGLLDVARSRTYLQDLARESADTSAIVAAGTSLAQRAREGARPMALQAAEQAAADAVSEATDVSGVSVSLEVCGDGSVTHATVHCPAGVSDSDARAVLQYASAYLSVAAAKVAVVRGSQKEDAS